MIWNGTSLLGGSFSILRERYIECQLWKNVYYESLTNSHSNSHLIDIVLHGTGNPYFNDQDL